VFLTSNHTPLKNIETFFEKLSKIVKIKSDNMDANRYGLKFTFQITNVPYHSVLLTHKIKRKFSRNGYENFNT